MSSSTSSLFWILKIETQSKIQWNAEKLFDIENVLSCQEVIPLEILMENKGSNVRLDILEKQTED